MTIPYRLGALLLGPFLLLRGAELTEAQVLQRFLDQNPIQRETRARVAIVQAETRGRTLWANPVVGVVREGAGRTEFYQASQTLPWNGRFALLRQSGVHLAAVLDGEGNFLLWQARCLLRSAFYRVLAVEQRQALLANADEELRRVVDTLKLRESAGEGSRFDRLRAERERAELAVTAQLLRADLAAAQGDMLALLPAETTLTPLSGNLNAPSPPADLAHWKQRALANRPDIQAERRRLDQFRAEQQAAQRLRIPEPAVIAGLKRAEQGLPSIANGPVLGVSLAIPLFNNGATEVARWSAEQERVSARLTQLVRRLDAAIDAAWQALAVHRQAQLDYDKKQVPPTDELVAIATTAYSEGEIGILQLLDAYRVRRESRLRALDLAAMAKQSQIDLEAQIGEEFPQ